MTDHKERRQKALVDIIRSGAFASQEEVVERLVALGFAATQATVSRDLEQIGAVKARRGGQLSYTLRESVQGGAGPHVAAVFRDWVRSVEPAANLVVIRTPPGSAHLVGVALDQSDLPEIVGTICGDDTIFIACRVSVEAERLAATLRAQAT